MSALGDDPQCLPVLLASGATLRRDVEVVVVQGECSAVLPGVVVERLVDVVAVDPRNLSELTVGQADPDLADVVGVVVDLPFPASAGDRGGLAAVVG